MRVLAACRPGAGELYWTDTRAIVHPRMRRVRIAYRASPRLTLNVQDAVGTPAPGTAVSLVFTWPDAADVEGFAFFSGHLLQHTWSGTTDSRGSVALESCPGDLAMTVSCGAGPGRAAAPLDIRTDLKVIVPNRIFRTASKGDHSVTLRLLKTTGVEVSVLTSTGSPEGHIPVTFEYELPVDRAAGRLTAVTTTDGNARFAVPLHDADSPPERTERRFRALALRSDGRVASATGIIHAGMRVDLRFADDGQPTTVATATFVDAKSGDPLADLEVECMTSWFGEQVTTLRTDAAGRVDLSLTIDPGINAPDLPWEPLVFSVRAAYRRGFDPASEGALAWSRLSPGDRRTVRLAPRR